MWNIFIYLSTETVSDTTVVSISTRYLYNCIGTLVYNLIRLHLHKPSAYVYPGNSVGRLPHGKGNN